MNLRDESGMTLVELLLVMIMSLFILGATLTTFNQTYQAQHDNDDRNVTAERAREALDVQSRQLRNLAKRLNNSDVIDTASGNNLIFQTSDPSRTWVRYCLNTSAPASPDRAQLWMAELTVPVGAPTAPVTGPMRNPSDCPGSGWTKTNIVADYVTNSRAGLNRPLFTYRCTSGTATCTSSPSTYDQIINISAQTFVDNTPGKAAPELRLATGVYLRNQNQVPEARFVSTPSVKPRTVVLNASGSTDFEGRTLTYYWFKHTLPAVANIRCDTPVVTGSGSNRTMWGANYIGTGITLTHTFDAVPADPASGSTRNIGLVACDPGDRYGTAGISPQAPIAVVIPN